MNIFVDSSLSDDSRRAELYTRFEFCSFIRRRVP